MEFLAPNDVFRLGGRCVPFGSGVEAQLRVFSDQGNPVGGAIGSVNPLTEPSAYAIVVRGSLSQWQ